MDSDTKPKPTFSINLGFLRLSTLVISFFAFISGSLCPDPYRCSGVEWKLPLYSFMTSLMFTLIHWFGKSDKWLNKEYRRQTFILSGFLEAVISLIWAIRYAYLYMCSDEMAQYRGGYEIYGPQYANFLIEMMPLYITLILSFINTFGFAAMTFGLIRWLFVENKILEKLRSGFQAVPIPLVTSDRAFSISCSALRLSTLISAAVSACLAYFFTCPPRGFDAIFIISVSSCAISFAFLVIGWTKVLEKNWSWPILPQIITALEVILSALIAIFYGMLYGLCINNLLSPGGEFKRQPANSAAHGILPLIEFNVLVFVILASSLIGHLFIERKMAEKMQKLVEAEP